MIESMMNPEFQQKLDNMAKKLADEGRLVEAGWLALRRMALPPNAPQDQVAAMRFAFMSGAQHIWGGFIASLDSGDEPSEADMRRLHLVDAELKAFYLEIMAGKETHGTA